MDDLDAQIEEENAVTEDLAAELAVMEAPTPEVQETDDRKRRRLARKSTPIMDDPPASLACEEPVPVGDSQTAEECDIQTMLQELLDSAPERTLGDADQIDGLDVGDIRTDLEVMKIKIVIEIPNLPDHPHVIRLCQLSIASPLLLFNGVWWVLAFWRRSWFSRLLREICSSARTSLLHTHTSPRMAPGTSSSTHYPRGP